MQSGFRGALFRISVSVNAIRKSGETIDGFSGMLNQTMK
jgi:hypothetical protein